MGILQYRTDLDTNKIISSKMIFGMRLASLNFDIRNIGETLPKWQTSIFNYVSNNLLREKGYIDTMDEGLNVPHLVELLNQALEIFKAGLTKYDCSYAENLPYMHDFFEGFVNHPDGSSSAIYIVKHDDNGYILMLPSDYERYFNQSAILPPLSLYDVNHRSEKISEINE
mgnify:FL=1